MCIGSRQPVVCVLCWNENYELIDNIYVII